MENFIFDMDGTLFATEKIYYESWLELSAQMGFPFDMETKYKLAGLQNKEAINFMVENFSMTKDEAIAARVRLNEIRNRMLDELDFSLCKKGVIELLNYLKENKKKIVLASSSAKARVNYLLDREGVREYFDLVITGDEITNGKPNPEIFEKALNDLSLDPKESYIVEDSLAGITAAKKTDATAVLVLDLDKRDTLKEKADLVFDDMGEFLNYLKEEEKKESQIEENRPMTFSLTCPNCKKDFEKELTTAIFSDSDEASDLKETNFKEITCPNCGHEFTLNYRFVYTDNEKKIMLVNDPKFLDKRNVLAFKSSLRLLDRLRKDEIKNFSIRMTTNSLDLKEKILIFEDGLDDRIVELMKFFIKESDGIKIPADKIDSFYYKGKKFLISVGKEVFEIDFVEELYKMLEEKYGLYLQDSIAEVIDKDWAEKFMKDMYENKSK